MGQRKKERKLLQMEEGARRLARQIKKSLPEGIGFTLFLFEFGGPGSWMTYLSSAQRDDMIATIEEWLEKEKRTPGGIGRMPN